MSEALRDVGSERDEAVTGWTPALFARFAGLMRQGGFLPVIAGFCLLGIMLGVATVIYSMVVMNGFRKDLLGKILGVNGHLVVHPLESPLTDWEEVAKRIALVPGVRFAVPVVDGEALGSSPFGAGAVLVRGMRLEDINRLSVAGNVRQGSLEHFDDGEGVVIGSRLAETLIVHAGDTITLVAPRGAVTPMGVTPRIKSYRVAAVFKVGMSDYDARLVFMPLSQAQAYFNRNNDVSAIEVFISSPDDVDSFHAPITTAADRPIALVDWRQRNAVFFNALQVEFNEMFKILSILALMVGGQILVVVKLVLSRSPAILAAPPVTGNAGFLRGKR